MRIIVTGGSGYFGSCLRPFLPIDTIWMSRVEREGFTTTLPFSADYLIDMVPTGSRSEMITWAKQAGVEKVLFTSSGAVYGRNAWFPNEDSSLDPQSFYAADKWQAEYNWHASGIPLVIARCFTFCGIGLPLSPFAIGNFIQGALKGVITVTGRSYRSYLDSSDLAQWLTTLLFRHEGIFNVGSDRIIDTQSLAEMVRILVNPQAQIITNGWEGSAYIPCIAKAESIGLSQTGTLSQSILNLAESIK